MNDEYGLEDYARLAYEFAIRNPRVIELLQSTPLTEEIAKELLEYGIDIYVVDEEIEYDEDNVTPIGMIYSERISLSELYLSYLHLELEESQKEYASKKMIHPRSKLGSFNEEDKVDAFNRIKAIKFDVLTEKCSEKLSKITWGIGH